MEVKGDAYHPFLVKGDAHHPFLATSLLLIAQADAQHSSMHNFSIGVLYVAGKIMPIPHDSMLLKWVFHKTQCREFPY